MTLPVILRPAVYYVVFADRVEVLAVFARGEGRVFVEVAGVNDQR